MVCPILEWNEKQHKKIRIKGENLVLKVYETDRKKRKALRELSATIIDTVPNLREERAKVW